MPQRKSWKRLWARKYSPMLASVFILSYIKNKQFGMALNKMFVPEGGLEACYYDEHEFSNLSKNYGQFLKRQNLKKYALVYEQEFIDFVRFARNISKIDPRKLNIGQLTRLLEKFFNRLIQSSDHQFYSFLVLEGVASRVEEKLSKLPKGSEILKLVTTPYKRTKIINAQLKLLKIARDKDLSALKKHAKQYAWLPSYDPLDEFWTLSDFKKIISSIKDPELEIKKIQGSKNLLLYKKYINTIKDQNFKKEIEITHYFTYLKEMRDDYRRHAYFILRPFLKNLAEVIGVDYREINHLSLEEILESVKLGHSVASKRELNLRQKAYAITLVQGKIRMYSGRKAELVAKKVVRKISSFIKGNCASVGKTTGKARIIFHQAEFKKFKKGEILITTMTHPEFLPIMKQARAIVTDEGGITSHAAIVSRELGIPAIIGTKNATRLLKDGDLVEVDANKGVVRKIK